MLKVLTFMKQVANGLQVEGNFGTAHVYRSSLNAIIAYSGKVDFTFDEVSPEWLKDLKYIFAVVVAVGTPFPLICARFVRFTIVPLIFGKLLMYLICSVLFIPVLVPTINVHWAMKI